LHNLSARLSRLKSTNRRHRPLLRRGVGLIHGGNDQELQHEQERTHEHHDRCRYRHKHAQQLPNSRG
jgi:hypothetical protein